LRDKKREISVEQQIFVMNKLFPQFKYYRSNKGSTWKGWLQPTQQSLKYSILIRYPSNKIPSVWIKYPEIRKNVPHRYRDGSLCLYFPEDNSWNPNMFLAKQIIPWVAEWLRFYEIWMITGKWYGEEASHSKVKTSK